MQPLYFALVSATIVSLISLICVFFIFVKTNLLKRITVFLVSFAIGGLLGDAFIHLIPESYEKFNSGSTVGLLIIAGIILFFILEKILRWRHCHEIGCEENDGKHIIALNLVGDGVHNFIDGMIIAASFIVSPAVGFTTTLAVILHEIPQEIGHFGIFIHQGLSIKKALLYNFISALTCIIGVIFTFTLGSNINGLSATLIPITAGGFIYLASSDLIPELNRHSSKVSNSIIQLIIILLGIGLMSLLVFLE